MAKLDIIATINTVKATEDYIQSLIQHGATILRLNGAHILLENLPGAVAFLREAGKGKAAVMIDIPGSKIRTKNIFRPIALRQGETLVLERSNFNFESFIDYVEAGDALASTDGQLTLLIQEKTAEKMSLTAQCDGVLLDGKGVHATEKRLTGMPLFSERDKKIVEICKDTQVDYAGISFARSPLDIHEANAAFAESGVKPIIKIETKEAAAPETLDAFLDAHELFNIDRGDLASEVGMFRFPEVFTRVQEAAIQKRKKLFVATQLFASMYENKIPYLSEIVEFYRLANAGIQGIQLSDETAVGKYPLEVLRLIREVTR